MGAMASEAGIAVRPEEELPRLLRRLALELRAGAFAADEARGRAVLAILWGMTIAKLREGNPLFLAENGFGD